MPISDKIWNGSRFDTINSDTLDDVDSSQFARINHTHNALDAARGGAHYIWADRYNAWDTRLYMSYLNDIGTSDASKKHNTVRVAFSDFATQSIGTEIVDTRGANRPPSYYPRRNARFDFVESSHTGAGGDTWNTLLTVSPWASFHSSHRQQQLAFTGSTIKYRCATSDAAWGGWLEFLHTSGGQAIVKNNPAIAADSYHAAKCHMELRTTNQSHPALSFHRSGATAVTLYHDAGKQLKVRDANSSFDGRVLIASNIGNEAGMFDITSTNPTGTTRMNYSGYLYTTRTYNAVWNDYAEYFERDKSQEFEHGDVIISNGDGTYAKSTHKNDQRVIGVYSDSFGQCLGGKGDDKDEENYLSIGLAGRVKVKLIGKISNGDLVCASDIPGVAMKSETYIPGTIIGKAVTDKLTEEIERVEVLIMTI